MCTQVRECCGWAQEYRRTWHGYLWISPSGWESNAQEASSVWKREVCQVFNHFLKHKYYLCMAQIFLTLPNSQQNNFIRSSQAVFRSTLRWGELAWGDYTTSLGEWWQNYKLSRAAVQYSIFFETLASGNRHLAQLSQQKWVPKSVGKIFWIQVFLGLGSHMGPV